MTSYRREILDPKLETAVAGLRGTILDLGGKRARPRGRFRPAPRPDVRWIYLNIEPLTQPHVLGDAHALPLAPQCLDAIVCAEVLEHVDNPAQCCAEVFAALKPGGAFVFSVPFLYPIHADPYDFTRFTAQALRRLCAEFAEVRIEPMGSWLGTVGMFLEIGSRSLGGALHRTIVRKALRLLGRTLCRLDARGFWPVESFTTGYFCVATKAPLR